MCGTQNPTVLLLRRELLRQALCLAVSIHHSVLLMAL